MLQPDASDDWTKVSKDDVTIILADRVVIAWVHCWSQDKYGRILADISPTPWSESVNNTLLLEGLAVPYGGGNKAAAWAKSDAAQIHKSSSD
jgi:endonuclease YncB( thermonuclease family)